MYRIRFEIKKNAIGEPSLDITIQELKVFDIEIEIATIVVKVSVKLIVPPDPQQQSRRKKKFVSPSCL